MKRKLLVLSAVIFVFIFLALGCSKSNKDPNEAANFLKDLNTYTTDFSMDIKNDKQTITYEGKHFYSKNLGHRMEIGKDRVLVYKDDKIYVNDVKYNLKYTLDRQFDTGFILSFVEEYVKLLYANEDIKYKFKDIDGKSYELIEFLIPGTNKAVSKAVLYMDFKDKSPEQIIVYDDKDGERIRITYKNFQGNNEVDKKLFKVD